MVRYSIASCQSELLLQLFHQQEYLQKSDKGVRMFIRLLSLFLFLKVPSGAEIQNVQVHCHTLNAEEGQHLLIPCTFQVDEPLGDNQVELEWSVIYEVKNIYEPIIRLNDHMFLPVKNPNRRAWINLPGVRMGNCSLVISPVSFRDSGIYRVRIAINGEEFPGAATINVHIFKSHQARALNQQNDQEPQSRKANETDGEDEDPENVIRWIEMFIRAMDKKSYLLYLKIAGGILVSLLLVNIVARIFFGCCIYQLVRKLPEAIVQIEEGLASQATDRESINSKDPT
ncbi:uncharacterized protein [Pyxicephalus adspersus]|uniref:Immunoglobulin V-set domain-containing protein n=1 Tax=Pyxicephalus adspersus TaxID=30357 RepID=A0AAV3A0E0_PYXAD|nr:TPA: hypothetical protein GDO54_015204 [Pyxicephalus adspersus]